MPSLMRLHYLIRKNPLVRVAIYSLPNLYYAARFALGIDKIAPHPEADLVPRGRLAFCLRFRDEARFLAEWLDYYVAAGVDHFYLYNNFSKDDFQSVLAPYIAGGKVTLIDWPRAPASPDAENDCIRRTIGRFDWVGFFDADEFAVIADGRAIPDFLADYPDACGLALHNFHFGSNGHKNRPQGWVIDAYTRRDANANIHFKMLVRPDKVTRNRNSHNFYYRGGRWAVNEEGRPVCGSLDDRPSTKRAWLNHYLYKSLEDYLEKASRGSTLDRSGMNWPGRAIELAQAAMSSANDVTDTTARAYYDMRRRAAAA